ncbi:MAG: hypothetical protein H6654_05965 [Ardenticatenaceae bacterium]|nr:hypothetical protein [Anaerolineales bacterium]MCB8973087.1 hypothetical protein [Ardenticatenaceae bacterium]
MKQQRHSFKLLILFLLVGVWVWPETAVPPAAAAPNQQSARDPRFGAVESFWAPGEAAELGVGWERILFYWNEIQPTGPNDWNTLHVHEEWLAEATAQGRTVVGLLKNTPNWATDGEFASGVPRGLYLPVDDPGNLWANYARRVASYYSAHGVHNWIVWNEPDIAAEVYGHEFSGSMADYYQLVKVAYIAIKQVDPNAKIHLGGMTYWHDPTWLGRFMQMVAADPDAAANNYYFDVISLHIYFRPETIPQIVGNAFAVQQQVGIPLKAVWINETNARPSSDPEWPVVVQSFELDLEQQAWYIVQAYALGFYSGAGRIAVYKLIDINISPGDESWGLIRPYDFSKRPAFYAYQNTIKYLAGFTYPIQREQGGNYTIVRFDRPQGVTRVLWARTASSVTLNVPALAASGILVDPITGTETAVTPTGGSYSISLTGARCAGECYMGGAPLFLVEEGVGGGSTTPPVVASANTPTSGSGGEAVPTSNATAAPTNTPAPTETPYPTATNMLPVPLPSNTPTVTSTAVPTKIATEPPPATEIASVPTATEPVEAEEATISATDSGQAVAEQASSGLGFWVLGGTGLGVLLLAFAWLRRK